MHDGSCPCGTCYSEVYTDMLEVAEAGQVPVLLTQGEAMKLIVYQPTVAELEAFCSRDHLVRGLAHSVIVHHGHERFAS